MLADYREAQGRRPAPAGVHEARDVEDDSVRRMGRRRPPDYVAMYTRASPDGNASHALGLAVRGCRPIKRGREDQGCFVVVFGFFFCFLPV